MERTMKISQQDLPRFIITSLIEADVTQAHIEDFLSKVKPYGFLSVAVDLPFLDLAVDYLKDTNTHVTTVSSYPLGGMTTETKLDQVKYARDHGAFDIDISMDYLAIKSGDYAKVEEEVKQIMETARALKIVLIPQLAILTNEEKAKTCEVLLKGGCTSIKTNTGFGWVTEPEDVLFIRRLFGDDIQIEASGGVRTYEDAVNILNAGAESIHSSSAFAICGINESLAYVKRG